jgi:hypothetical protein
MTNPYKIPEVTSTIPRFLKTWLICAWVENEAQKIFARATDGSHWIKVSSQAGISNPIKTTKIDPVITTMVKLSQPVISC